MGTVQSKESSIVMFHARESNESFEKMLWSEEKKVTDVENVLSPTAVDDER
jgi:hypothetical protein